VGEGRKKKGDPGGDSYSCVDAEEKRNLGAKRIQVTSKVSFHNGDHVSQKGGGCLEQGKRSPPSSPERRASPFRRNPREGTEGRGGGGRDGKESWEAFPQD